jgi:hypothetical protein
MWAAAVGEGRAAGQNLGPGLGVGVPGAEIAGEEQLAVPGGGPRTALLLAMLLPLMLLVSPFTGATCPHTASSLLLGAPCLQQATRPHT